MKQYPNLQDYNLVVENLGSFGRLDLLQRAVPARGTGNRLIAYSGGYSRVYRMHLDGSSFALRCWTAEVPEALERYRCIDGFMRGRRPQSFVGFSYHEDALIVRGNLYSVLWMDWVEGETLRSFVNCHMGDGAMLEDLARRFLKMVRDLHDLGVSHGDLQDENILVQVGSDAQPHLRLIDYDSVFVPGLEGFTAPIAGIPDYQHPLRHTLAHACAETDYFSELVIYLSLRILAVYPNLWEPDGEKFLLFHDRDFRDPGRSALFARFGAEGGQIGRLTRALEELCRASDLAVFPPLERVLRPVVEVEGISLQIPPAPPKQPRSTPIDNFSGFIRTPPTTVGAKRSTPIDPIPDNFLKAPAAGPKPSHPVVAIPSNLLDTGAPATPRPTPPPAAAAAHDDHTGSPP